MIYTERQRSVSNAQLAKLRDALDALTALDKGGLNWLERAQRDALKSQIEEIASDIADFELLKSGKVSISEHSDLENLPRVLIQARVAQGISQKDLAEALNMKQQQIQRYEASRYMSASLGKLIRVAEVLNIKIVEVWEDTKRQKSGAVYSWKDPSNVNWKKFPLKEMISRGWLEIKSGQNLDEAIEEFFLSSAGPRFATALHRKKFHGANKSNEFSLLAWQSGVLNQGKALYQDGRLAEFQHDQSCVAELALLTHRLDGPSGAIDFLAEQGIALVVEPHFKNTYLDGAAMLADDGYPVIGLTLRFDRLDNFWFTLFHELGHVYLHLFEGLRFDFLFRQKICGNLVC